MLIHMQPMRQAMHVYQHRSLLFDCVVRGKDGCDGTRTGGELAAAMTAGNITELAQCTCRPASRSVAARWLRAPHPPRRFLCPQRGCALPWRERRSTHTQAHACKRSISQELRTSSRAPPNAAGHMMLRRIAIQPPAGEEVHCTRAPHTDSQSHASDPTPPIPRLRFHASDPTPLAPPIPHLNHTTGR